MNWIMTPDVAFWLIIYWVTLRLIVGTWRRS